MSKLKELKKSKPVKLNSAEQSLLSKYLKPRPRSPEPKEEPKVEPKLEPVPAEAPEPEKEMPEPTIPETIPVPLNINEQTVENVNRKTLRISLKIPRKLNRARKIMSSSFQRFRFREPVSLNLYFADRPDKVF